MAEDNPQNEKNAQPELDPVAQAFAAMRKEAMKRNGRVPDLSRQLSRSHAPKKNKGPRTLGRPTGPDGRRLPPRDRVEGLGSVLGAEISRRGWKKDISGGWIMANWSALVGEKIAAHTKIEMLKDKKLFITCDSTAWATNLRMMQRDILQTIASKVGPDVVEQLRIFGPKAPSWRHGPLHVKGRGPRDTYG